MNNVVITGVGAISVLGIDHEAISAALFQGSSGIVADEARRAYGFRSILTGAIPSFDASSFLSRKQRKSMPEFAQQAYVALMQAILQAQLPENLIQSEDCGIIFSNDSTVGSAFSLAEEKRVQGENTSLGSGHIFKIMNSTISMNIGAMLGVRGASWTVSSACSGGLLAIAQAVDAIRLGRQNIMLCGGAQELNPEGVCAFDGLSAFSVNPDPKNASRPFDSLRDGLVPSGGAAALVLESEEHAKKRGARILGKILGTGYSADGQDLVVPSHQGLALSMRRALKDANLQAKDITEINAHATSTVVGDISEAINIYSVFGDACPKVVALKGLTGHEFWMSGASQVVYATLMAERGFTAGTPTFSEGDEHTSKLPVLQKALSQPPKNMLCNAAGFGGSNASVIVGYHE